MNKTGSNLQQLGAGMMGCGCLIMLVPIVVGLVFILGVILSAGVD